MWTLRYAGLGILLAVVACGASRTEPSADDSTASPPVEEEGREAPPAGAPALTELTCDGLDEHILRAHSSREALERAFGAPARMESTTEPNRHIPGATDSIFVVHYSGLTSTFRKPPAGGDLPSHARATDNRYISYPTIGIGAEEGAVTRVLGPPTRSAGGTLVYECGTGAEEPVTFHLTDGSVQQIEVSYYVD